jgi:hypothetical protein
MTAEVNYDHPCHCGLWFQEDWLWAEQPNPLAALAQVAGAERVIAALRGVA